MRQALTHRFGRYLRGLAIVLAPLLLVPNSARAEVICTLIVEMRTGKVLLELGDCARRMTPASTFKLPLAVIGFDAGVLQNGDRPVYAYQPGDPDWGGDTWRRDTTPRDWLRYSVVWYSQRITRLLGSERLTFYLQALKFGNADVTGDPGADNGMERAWLSSSLQVSGHEQAAFLRRLFNGTLNVSQEAMTKTREIVQMERVAGWQMRAKTGGAYPRSADGGFDRENGIGWYVGWASKGHTHLVFVHLAQGGYSGNLSPGIAARKRLQLSWPAFMKGLGL